MGVVRRVKKGVKFGGGRVGWKVSVGSGGGSSSFGGAVTGMGEGSRVGGFGDWRLDWRDGGEEGGRDDMLLAAALEFLVRCIGECGLRICLVV